MPSLRSRGVGTALGILISVIAGGALDEARAAETQKHRLQRIGEDSLDLVMSVSWDFNAEANGGHPYIEKVLRTFADKTFVMTQGRLRVCKVFIFNKGEQRRKSDIYFDRTGRANTSEIGAIHTDLGQISLFRQFTNGAPLAESQVGTTLAHELGHYALYLKDEYTEPKEPGEGEQAFFGPRNCDVTLPLAMGSKGVMDLSIPKDYSDKNYAPWLPGNGFVAGDGGKESKYRSCEPLIDQEHYPDGGLTQPLYSGPKEDAQWRTAQWREHQMSAWDFLINGPQAKRFGAAASQRPTPIKRFKSITSGGNPTVPLVDPTLTKEADCHVPIFMEGTFVVLLLDRSNSMNQKKAPGSDVTLFDVAKENARRFVATAPPDTTIAIMTFADDGRVNLEPTHIGIEKADADQKRAAILNAINGLQTDSISSTNIDRGLIASAEMFVKNSTVGNTQYMVVLSDGFTTAAREYERLFQNIRVPVFTQRIGNDGNGRELIELADGTEGNYQASPDRAWTDLTIKELLFNREPIGIRTYPRPTDKAPIESPIQVGELDGPTSFHARWAQGDVVAFQLRAPDGTLIVPGALPPGVTYEPSDDGARFNVAQPAVGTWTPILLPAGIPTGDLRVHVSGDSAFTIKIDLDDYQSYPDPFFVRVKLAGPNPVTGAHVVAKLNPVIVPGALGEPPPGFQLDVRDDGVAPDQTANDGVYSAVFARVIDDGDYSLTILADNPNGAARLSVGGPDGQPESKTFPAFSRERSITISAVGSRPMPQSKDNAIRLRNDLTPLWGTINQPGESVWYEMNGFANGHYAIMTGELVSNDANGAPMKTSLTVFGPDGVTVLGTSAEEDGRAFIELKTPSTAGQYFMKVTHPGNGVGRFRIAAAPKEWFDRKGDGGAFGTSLSASGGEDGCDCRAGGTGERGAGFGALAVVALGTLGIARRISRKNKKKTTTNRTA